MSGKSSLAMQTLLAKAHTWRPERGGVPDKLNMRLICKTGLTWPFSNLRISRQLKDVPVISLRKQKGARTENVSKQ
jgi:hypothetical protein